VVADELARLVPLAQGEVLELGWRTERRYPSAVTGVRCLDGDPGGAGGGAQVDTIVSVCELWRPAWTTGRLRALFERLRPAGRLLVVEPVAVVGLSGRVQRLARPLTVALSGVAFDRDLPAEVRCAGLVPTTVVRTSIDPVGRVRTVARVVASRR
jgi:hypothetical protein